MNHLEVDSIKLSFDNRVILSDIFLSCKTEEIVGLIGRNGAGKSSLLKTIFGTLNAQNKSVRVNRVFYSRPLAAKELISFLPQEDFVPDYLTCNNLEQVYQFKFPAIEELKGIRSIPLSQLSSGQRRFVETICILHRPSQFVILDEPFSYIAPVLVEKLIELVKRASQTKGIIISDHQIESVFECCNKYYFLTDGCLTPIRSKNDLPLTYLPAHRR